LPGVTFANKEDYDNTNDKQAKDENLQLVYLSKKWLTAPTIYFKVSHLN